MKVLPLFAAVLHLFNKSFSKGLLDFSFLAISIV